MTSASFAVLVRFSVPLEVTASVPVTMAPDWVSCVAVWSVTAPATSPVISRLSASTKVTAEDSRFVAVAVACVPVVGGSITRLGADR